MPIATGSHHLDAGNASLRIRTYREGVAAKVGHDLVIEVTDWAAELVVADDPQGSTLTLRADPTSLRVREGLHGLKPLTDKDRAEIHRNIERKVLGTEEIRFRSRRVAAAAGGDGLAVEGDLTLAGATRPVAAQVGVGADGAVAATIGLTQSEWGIKPYRGLMGALKVRDDVEIALEARLPGA